MNYIQRAIEKATKEKIRQQKWKIIQDYTAAGKVTPQGLNAAIKAIQKAAEINTRRQPALIIANAATAAAIRKRFSKNEVEVIISQMVETAKAYIVVDEELKQQFLKNIEGKGD